MTRFDQQLSQAFPDATVAQVLLGTERLVHEPLADVAALYQEAAE